MKKGFCENRILSFVPSNQKNSETHFSEKQYNDLNPLKISSLPTITGEAWKLSSNALEATILKVSPALITRQMFSAAT
jgi:hypothetical protein